MIIRWSLVKFDITQSNFQTPLFKCSMAYNQFANSMNHNKANISFLNRTNMSEIQANTIYNSKDSQVDILFKGMKRKISQRQYSKIKNSYKVTKKDTEHACSNDNSIIGKTKKFRLSISSNQVINQDEVYEEVLKMKQQNHYLQEQNTELLRKIRKEEKIQQIYKKRMQGKDLSELTYEKALEIKLLLEVEDLQNYLYQKENQFARMQKEIRAKRNDSLTESKIFQTKLQLYSILINNQQQFDSVYGQKQKVCQENTTKIQTFKQKGSKQKQLKNQRKQQLNALKKQIKQRQQRLNQLQQEMKKKKTNTSIIKNGGTASSITVKNRNNIQEIESDIQKIKEQYQMLSEMMQTEMDQKIKQKIILHKQISQLQEAQKGKQSWNKVEPSPLTLTLKFNQ